MALTRGCDNPDCPVALEVTRENVDDLPAGWWVMERSEAVGKPATQYTVCSLDCVRHIADLFDDEAPVPEAPV